MVGTTATQLRIEESKTCSSSFCSARGGGGNWDEVEVAASESKEYYFRSEVRSRVPSAFDDRIRLHLVAPTETPRKLGAGRFGNLELLTL